MTSCLSWVRSSDPSASIASLLRSAAALASALPAPFNASIRTVIQGLTPVLTELKRAGRVTEETQLYHEMIDASNDPNHVPGVANCIASAMWRPS